MFVKTFEQTFSKKKKKSRPKDKIFNALKQYWKLYFARTKFRLPACISSDFSVSRRIWKTKNQTKYKTSVRYNIIVRNEIFLYRHAIDGLEFAHVRRPAGCVFLLSVLYFFFPSWTDRLTTAADYHRPFSSARRESIDIFLKIFSFFFIHIFT